ncbi:MAG: MFS transporter [Nanoarchaeota archaeon]|mgnify:CR=1 FL=1
MNFKLNKIVKYLVYSDLVFYSGWGLISPIFAIFLLDSIIGGTAFVVGMAAGINLIVRSLLRVPFGVMADRSQRISFHLMFWGLLIAAFVPIGYLYASLPWHVYILQIILGASLAMSTAGWTTLFSRHMDKGKESTEWGIDAVAVGLGPGIAGILGGAAVTLLGFNSVFIGVAILGLIGVLLLLVIKKDILKNHKLFSIGRTKKEEKLGELYELRRIKKARVA